jgi:hypothetical protein
MSPNNDRAKKVFAVKLTNGHFAIGESGEIAERRAHPRIATSAITRIEDQTHAILRAESVKREATQAERTEDRIEASQALADWYRVLLDRAQEEEKQS